MTSPGGAFRRGLLAAVSMTVLVMPVLGPGGTGTAQAQAEADRYASQGDAAEAWSRAAARGRTVPMSGQRQVVEWPDGPDEPAVVSTAEFYATPQREVTVPVDVSGKYDVTIGSREHIMDRLCVRMDLSLADTGELREQVWIDEASGAFLRRETFDEGQRVRIVSYLSLDLDAPPRPARSADPLRLSTEAQRAALRAAGWVLPAELAGGYELVETLVHVTTPGMPLQAIYSDGLYTVSLFAQPGAPDLDALPAGASHLEDLDDRRAYVLPGQLPVGILWAAPQQVLTLVGDAPRAELIDIAATLPADPPPGLWDRLVRGVRRIADAL